MNGKELHNKHQLKLRTRKNKRRKKKQRKKKLLLNLKKKKNPLDLLPETRFNLFDFKTLFVNAKDKKDACKFLWDNLDTEGFSIYILKYIKAEGEGKILF